MASNLALISTFYHKNAKLPWLAAGNGLFASVFLLGNEDIVKRERLHIAM